MSDWREPAVLKVSRKVHEAALGVIAEAGKEGVFPAFELARHRWKETGDGFWREVYEFMAEWETAAQGSTVEIED